MIWEIELHTAFETEYRALSEDVQDALLEELLFLEKEGPNLGRPHVDTLKGSKHANMKELRFRADGGVWRVAFAFDVTRRAILLVAGDKSGTSQQRFYKQLIRKADQRFDEHLATLRGDHPHG